MLHTRVQGEEAAYPVGSVFRKLRRGAIGAADILVVWTPDRDSLPAQAALGAVVEDVWDDDGELPENAWQRLRPVVVDDEHWLDWLRRDAVASLPFEYGEFVAGGSLGPIRTPDPLSPTGTPDGSANDSLGEKVEASVQQVVGRLTLAASSGRTTAIIRDAGRRQLAIDRVTAAIEALRDWEGKGIETALFEEFVIPDLEYSLDALNLESHVLEELLEAHDSVRSGLQTSEGLERVFLKGGEYAIAGIVRRVVQALVDGM